jgi:hypothetical protein
MDEVLSEFQIERMSKLEAENSVFRKEAVEDRGESAALQQLRDEKLNLELELQCAVKNYENERVRSRKYKEELHRLRHDMGSTLSK